MYLELDGQGPRYAQLTRGLKQAILGGRVAAHSRLPATRVLARDLDLSRNTVLAAYEQLAAEGFIEGRVGSGCYVAAIEALPAAQPAKATTRTGAARAPLAPAVLEVLEPRRARLTLTEGRYHQARRMFAAVGNHVEALHRSRVGGLTLGDLELGKWRPLESADLAKLFAGKH